jgi:YidC/Oxa1 family membrane protein insertase
MFDRTTWISIALSVAGLVGWQYYYSKTYAPYIAQQAEMQREQRLAKLNTQSPKPLPSPTPSATVLPISALTAQATPSQSPAGVLGSTPVTNSPVIPEISAKRATLDTSRAEYLFANNTGGIESVTLFLHLGANEQSLFLNKDSGLPIGALCDASGTPIGGFTMDADKGKGITSFSLTAPSGLAITKAFTLPRTVGSPEEYVVKMDLTFINKGSNPLSLPGFSVAAGGEAPVHIKDLPTYTSFDWYKDGKIVDGKIDGAKMPSPINVNWFEAGKIPLVGIETHPARDLYTEADAVVWWAAVTSQYFCTIVTAPKDQPGSGVWSRRYLARDAVESSNSQPVYGITGGLGTGSITLAPGETVTRSYSIYAGPKDFYSLGKLGEDQQKIMNFGMFHLVSEFLLWAMNAIDKVTHSFAAAIIILTILIKSALWPLQNKATTSMKRMQQLSPKMTELREKYKDDPTKMNEELMKLYKQYGVNPFGGCLPMLVQIPIFFGFYSMLGSAIELRNSHFLWIHDLSQPDTLTHIMGFPINLLPLIMAGTMVWQMMISPKSGDATQQRMMYFMPVIFLTFAYNYASGLALYWTTQNIFSIVQLYWTRNQEAPKLQVIKPKAAPKKKGNGGSNFTKKS